MRMKRSSDGSRKENNMSEQAKQLAKLKQQILEQISEEELEAAVGAKEGYATIKPDDLILNHPLVNLNTGVRRVYPLAVNTGVRFPDHPKW
jgi:hypothetical protein